MKKITPSKICFGVSMVMLVTLAIKIVVDAIRYPSTFTSAPFWVWALADCVSFLPIALIFLVIGLILRAREKKMDSLK